MINRPLFCAASDVEIRESFRKFVKDNQFARAAAAADATGLSLQQAAEREGHILKASQKAAGWLYLCCSNIPEGLYAVMNFVFGVLSHPWLRPHPPRLPPAKTDPSGRSTASTGQRLSSTPG